MNKHELLSIFKNVKPSGEGYTALCPAHDDHHPSLSIKFNGDWCNLHCFTGCSQDDILQAVGLSKKDLFLGEKKENAKLVKTITYDYHNKDGVLSYRRERREYDDGTKKFYFVRPDGTFGMQTKFHLLYNLPKVIESDTVYIVEGEKCAEAVNNQGYTATTLDGGANSVWLNSYEDYLERKKIIIIPDNDKPGMAYAKRIKKNLPWAVIKILPDLQEKEDIYDWLQAGHKMSEIDDLPEFTYESEDEDDEEGSVDYSFDKRQQSMILLDVIKAEKPELFLDENNNPCIEVQIDKHKEIYAIDSRDFMLWAQRLFFQATKRAVGKESLKQVIDLICAESKFEDKPRFSLDTRVSKEQGAFWYDLTNNDWSAVKTTPDGWSIISDVPKMFRRYRHQLPQVTPQSGGDLTLIFNHINMIKYQTLFACWLVSCFIPDIPHPMPIIYGEKGAAKSTACVLLKRLIDPSALSTLTLSNEERTLVVNLQQHYYLPFDNVSGISEKTSDTLCRAVTGSAVQQRKLYTNADDYIFTFKRCITINGINNVANRSDLLDRSILFELERVSKDKRKELQKVYDSFEADKPLILGAIFDTLMKAMSIYPTVVLDKLPRMADFCRWGYAIAEALGIKGEQFLQEYEANQVVQNTEAINSDVVAFLVVEYMRYKDNWTGRISKLFSELQDTAEKQGINPRSKNMPQSPNYLSRRINAVKSNLEAVGITYEINTKRSDGHYITLCNHNLAPLSPVYVDISSDYGKYGGGDTIPLPPPASPSVELDNGANGGNGGNTDFNNDSDEDDDVVF